MHKATHPNVRTRSTLVFESRAVLKIDGQSEGLTKLSRNVNFNVLGQNS
jgi:hypothetical protein